MGRIPSTGLKKGGFVRGAKVRIGKNKYSDGREYHIPPASGIDNSDMADLFCLPPAGCSRRLFYKKTLVAPDFPVEEFAVRPFLDLVEPVYYGKMKRYVRKPSRDFRSSTHKLMISHPSFLLVGDKRAGSIPAAVKVVPTAEFIRIQYSGLPEAWVLEAQHLALVKGAWACVIVYCPFYSDILNYDIEGDPAVAQEILSAAKDFWVCVEKQEAPPRFDKTDKRCFLCPFRIVCQGEEFRKPKADTKMNEIARRMIFLDDEAQSITDARKALQGESLRAMGSKYVVDTAYGTIDASTRKQVKIDTAKLFKDHPDLKKKYGKQVPVKEPKLVPWNKS